MAEVVPDNLRLGVASIDREHERLLGTLDRLHAAVVKRESVAVVQPLFEDVRRVAFEHFEWEEQEVGRYGYPDLPRHQEEHRRLAAMLSELADRFGREPAAAFDTALFLREWIEHHILDFDAPAVRHILAAQFRGAASE